MRQEVILNYKRNFIIDSYVWKKLFFASYKQKRDENNNVAPCEQKWSD
jgi:hypothetical protein